MNKAKLNYFVDVIMGIAFLIAFVTGVFKFPGFGDNIAAVFGVSPSYTMSRIHDWSGLVMGVMVFVHLALHWGWIVAMTKNMFKKNEK